ncbi:hypothetical protein ACJMK2_027258 [Sinanodonta woodiana]|uniref:G-protein coupled receptors family 2 profile 2 domain-containing protein n=1 Tax=Sinanodonta woodiana TaxID=1069815 RepID=A0ABD3XM86_SINWO
MCNNSSSYDADKRIQYASAVCTIVSSLLSICGAFIIFWSYWQISSIRNFPRKLLTCLTVADFMIASGNLVGATELLFGYTNGTVGVSKPDTGVCKAQSFITTFAAMASFFWTLVITAHMMVAIQFQSNRTRSAVLNVLYHVLCWGTPGIITVIADASNVLGRNKKTSTAGAVTWCWINTNDTKWMLITGKGWEILCYILSLSILVLLKLKLYLSRRRLKEFQQDFRDEDTHFLYIWLVLWLFRVWGTIRFILILICGDTNNKPLIILQSIGDSAQAFGNCVLFCFLDKDVAKYIKKKCLPCKFSGEEDRLIASTTVSANSEIETF